MANKNFLLAASVLLACSPLAHAADLSSIQIPYEKFVLPNGLTLIVHEDHKALIIATALFARYQSSDPIAIYLCAMCGVTIISILLLGRRQHAAD